MILKEIEVVNFKVLKDAHYKFANAIYFFKGKNEIGKTTLLNAIGSLLTGDRSGNLLKKGESEGKVLGVIGDDNEDYEVEIRFTEKNPRGTIRIARVGDEFGASNKISVLQKIFKYQEFDANEFVSWSKTADGRRKQVEAVRGLLPDEINQEIDDLDLEYKQKYDSRTNVNAELKVFTSLLKSDPLDIVDPEKYQSKREKELTDLISKKNESILFNSKIENEAESFKTLEKELIGFDENAKGVKVDLENDILSFKNEAKRIEQEIEEKKKQLAAKIEEVKEKETKIKGIIDNQAKEKNDLHGRIKAGQKYFSENKPIIITEIDDKINEVQKFNEIVDKVAVYNSNLKKMNQKKQESLKLDNALESIKTRKKSLISDSKLPITGLTFSEDGLFLNGIPFESGEVSTSQEMEVASRLIIAKNPNVKVFKMLQGESMDEDKIKSLVDFAKKEGYQGFIEQVERGQSELLIEEYVEG